MNSKLLSITICCTLLLFITNGFAADTPVPTQGAGFHSTLCTSDGSIRDDELADYVAAQIKANGGKVKDVKIMINSCYGGGLLDDFQRVFGPEGDCAGTKWVGGSASTAEQCAEGWDDSVVNDPKHTAKNLGSCWTDALAGVATSTANTNPGSIRDGASDNVKTDLTAAMNHDDSGPNHDKTENPVIGSGNGGENIAWNAAGTSHSAVVFGGMQTDARHHNNVENVRNALTGVWGESSYIVQTLDGGTKQQLKSAIAAACSTLNENTQLVLYFDDHGNTEFDAIEWWEDLYNSVFQIITEYNPFNEIFDLHEGWTQGLDGMYLQGDPVIPTLNLTLANTILGEEWAILLNGTLIDLPAGILTGDLVLPIDRTAIKVMDNNMQIYALGTPTYGMELTNLELSSGPINEINKIPEPATICLLSFGILSLLRTRRDKNAL